MPDRYINIDISSNDGGLPAGVPLKEALDDIPKNVIGAELNGKLYGLEDPLNDSGQYRLLTVDSVGAMELFWHSSAHLLAQAVKRLYPHAKLGIGPAIKNGFYYDFDFGEPISSDDLPKIEEEMKNCVLSNEAIKRSELTPQEAKNFFDGDGQDYKLELIEGINEQISTYSQGEFTDLCRGPHLPSTGLIKNFKLLALTGAYWRGSERNPMLQRIYGTAFPNAKQLREHLRRLEEAKKRDHRLVGKQLGLFSFHPEAPGAPFWHDKGVILFDEIQGYLRGVLRKHSYKEVRTPLVLVKELWERSGHWDHYHNNMYFTCVEDRDYAMKPMNCPGAVMMYGERQWSYRDLPQRWSEIGIVHRYEKSGALHGLFRVRQITQDDAHIFCTPEQLVDEIIAMIELVYEVFEHFGMSDIAVELSTRPKDRIGDEELWDRAEEALLTALKQNDIAYEINEGEGAFYGPKIDFHVSDSLGRTWQCSTIQLDFNFPERFDLEYVGADNQPHRPVMLHRTILGSVERFIGILTEHYGGDFPLWLAPRQAIALPITDKQNAVAQGVMERLIQTGFRCEIDERNEKIGKKIRESELLKIPYMLVIGAREAESNSVSVRRRGQGDLGVMDIEVLIGTMQREIDNLQ
ncbi:MAG: threonine--tRNA ligase [Candidatus Electryoneaceae bacterium]|nr:threonine--tRNA ligase [Candidatus Electryoneaceae bacterium]